MTTYTQKVQLGTGLDLATFIKQTIDAGGPDKLTKVEINATQTEATLTFEQI